MTGTVPALRDARELGAADLAALLALNNAHATELSHLAPERFQRLLGAAWLAFAADDHSALLLAFDHAATHDSPNFLWFRNRWSRFAYVDRVVVSRAARGRGIARALYGRVLARAGAPHRG